MKKLHQKPQTTDINILGMNDAIRTSSVLADKGFKIKYWHWLKINISGDMACQ